MAVNGSDFMGNVTANQVAASQASGQAGDTGDRAGNEPLILLCRAVIAGYEAGMSGMDDVQLQNLIALGDQAQALIDAIRIKTGTIGAGMQTAHVDALLRSVLADVRLPSAVEVGRQAALVTVRGTDVQPLLHVTNLSDPAVWQAMSDLMAGESTGQRWTARQLGELFTAAHNVVWDLEPAEA